MSALAGLLRADLKNVTRDPMLVLLTILPLALASVIRWGLPPASEEVAARFGFDLRPYFPFAASIVALLPALMYGWVIAFVLLDERDERVLTAIAVTPLGSRGYLAYRLVQPIVVAAVLAQVAVRVADLTPVGAGHLLAVAVLAALSAPFQALFLAAIARDKVQGLALAKLFSLILLAPFATVTIASPWQYLAGVVPPFWVSRALLDAVSSSPRWWLDLFCGVLAHGVWLLVLGALFVRRRG